MDPAQCIVRRANVDDLPGLKQLWERSGLQVLDLERRLTEFQLISSLEGDLIGAAGLHLEGKQGWLHSEAFLRPEEEEAFRPMLWDRFRTLARNHGLARLWTLEQSPFWHQNGFVLADAEAIKRLPARFGDPHHQWFTLALRDEGGDAISIDREFQLFQQASRADTEQVLESARKLKSVALVVGLVFFLACFGVAVYYLVRWLRAGGSGPLRAR